MAGSWSNPNPSDFTAARAQSGYQLQHINMAPLFAAIMEAKHRKEQEQQQQIQEALQGVSSAVGGYMQGRDNSALSDYQQQSLQGQTTMSADQAQADLARMSPEARIKAMQWTQGQQQNALNQNMTAWKFQNAQDLAPYQKADIVSRIGNNIALANQRTLNPRGTMTAGQDAVAGRSAARGIKEDLSDEFDASPYDFNKVTYGDFDDKGFFQANPKGKLAMVGDPIMSHIPEAKGILGMGAHPAQDVPSSYKNVFPRDQVDTAKLDANRYFKLARSGGTSDAVAPAQSQAGPPVGTKGVVQGQPAYWDGHGWVPIQ